MKISLNWLKTLINIDLETEDLCHRLTMSGLEVEGVERIESIRGGLQGLLVGEVIEKWQHPDADRLSLTKVNIGEAELLQIVCGAPNVATGQKVVVAPVGCTIFPLRGEPFKIKKAKIRGELSQGMICAEDEIGMGEDHDGIMVLDENAPIGEPFRNLVELEDDEVIEIGLTPNRGDAASHWGVAREIAALLGQKPSWPAMPEIEKLAEKGIEIEVQNSTDCPRYSGLLMEGLQVAESPDWLKNRMRAIGLNPINNVVDVTNYVLHELGQPIHAFDADKIAGGKIVVRTATKGEKITTLDKVDRTLEGIELLICDTKKPLAIAGVFGGLHSGVSDQTKRIFIESAYFHPVSIRKTAKKHGLNTDASFRYERGTDPDITLYALRRMVQLLGETAGAQVASAVVDIYPEPIKPFEVYFRWAELSRMAGINPGREMVLGILNSLEIAVASEDEGGLHLLVPPYRSDVNREIDVIEEIVRIYGLDRLPMPEKVQYTPVYEKNEMFALKREISAYLRDIGFAEMMNNSLTQGEFYSEEMSVKLMNPLSKELSVLRADMLHPALHSVAWNKNRKNRDLRLFEMGKVYWPSEKGGAEEEERLLLVLSGKTFGEHWQVKSQQLDYYAIKGAVEALLNRLGLKWNDKFGTIAQAERKVLALFDIKDEVWYADLSLKALLKQRRKYRFELQPVPLFPEVRRDLSLKIPADVNYASLKEIALRNGGKYLRDTGIFDVFEDKKLGEGLKSYSLSFVLYNPERTMSDQETDKIMNRLIEAFEREAGAEVRK